MRPLDYFYKIENNISEHVVRPKLTEIVGARLKAGPLCFSLIGGNKGKSKAEILAWDCFPTWHIPWRIWTLPVFNDPNDVNAAIRRLENQVSLLVTENRRLWHETQELRDLVASSNGRPNEKNILVSTGRTSETLRTPERTINLTIQIASNKAGSSKNNEMKIEEDELIETGPKISPLLDSRPKFLLKSTPQNDLNLVDYVSSSPSSSCQERGKEILPRRGAGPRLGQALGQVMVATPRSSRHDILRLLKPGNERYQAGPSWRHPQEKPPFLGISRNDRQLQTILENDFDESSIGQTIQQLRTRVKSIHKEVSVLRLKNDQIEKMLDKLMHAAAAAASAVDSEKSETNID